MKKITIKDIAKLAECSETTVSRVINGKYGSMSEATRKRVEAIMEAHDYKPSLAAQMLRSNKSNMIGVIVADLDSPYTAAMVNALSMSCESAGYAILIAISNGRIEEEQANINRLLLHRVDGLIIQTVGDNDEALVELKKQRIPVVLLDREIEPLVFPVVTSNNQSLMQDALQFIYKSGFTSLAYFSEPLTNSVRRMRHQSLLEQVENLEYVTTIITETSDAGKIQNGLLELARLPGPRIIFSANGLMALQVLKEMQQLSFTLNEDFYFISFDEFVWSGVTGGGITTIEQDVNEIATIASTLLLDTLQQNDKETFIEKKAKDLRIEVSGKLHIRQSTQIKERKL